MNDYLKVILSLMSYKRLITTLSYKLRDGGLRTTLDANSDLTTSGEMGSMKQEITADIDGFIVDMKTYISENVSCFPLYTNGFAGVGSDSVNLSIGKVQNPGKSIYNNYR